MHHNRERKEIGGHEVNMQVTKKIMKRMAENSEETKDRRHN